MSSKIVIVGGPADGQKIERPTASTVKIPVLGKGGFGSFDYTLRSCRDTRGAIIEVLAPAGRPIDPAYLVAHKLTN